MGGRKEEFNGALENIKGYVIGNGGEILRIGFKYDEAIGGLADRLNRGADEIEKLLGTVAASDYF